MLKSICIQPAYFASIAQYAAILQTKNLTFEVCDHFLKQTYRTRCYVYSANGKLLLNVPVNKNKEQKKITQKVEINYAENWQALHLKSLQSAYRSSPFFEYYEDDLMPIFKTKHQYLWQLHQQCHEFVMDALQENKKYSNTISYSKNITDEKDLRNWIDPKQTPNINFPKYVQMFDHKYGFIPNLSILDLIFMEGPNANLYLEHLDLSNT